MMHEDFNDSQRAASYLSCGLSADFPEAKVEIVAYPGGRSPARKRVVDTAHLESVLERMCSKYPGRRVHVDYDPEHENGLVGVLRCACRKLGRDKCNHQCTSETERPHVVVRIQLDAPVESSAPRPQ